MTVATIRDRARGERASGLLSSVIGVACVAAVLGVAVNVALGLWTRSTVDAVAYDVARDIATAPQGTDRSEVARDAVRRGTSALGTYGTEVRFDVESTGDVVVVRVQAPGVGLLPAMIGGGPTVAALDRRIVVRTESP